MEAPAALEFLLVSNIHKTLAAVDGGLEQIGIKFNIAPTSSSCRAVIWLPAEARLYGSTAKA
jgi:hypothetical protein